MMQRSVLVAVFTTISITFMAAVAGSGERSKMQKIILKAEGKEVALLLPASHLNPGYVLNEKYVVANALFPTMESVNVNDPKKLPTTIRIDISIDRGMTRAESFLRDVDRLSAKNVPAKPVLISEEGDAKKYSVKISGSGRAVIHRITRSEDGRPIDTVDKGEWAATYQVNRVVGPLEVTYQYHKSLKEQEGDVARAVERFIDSIVVK